MTIIILSVSVALLAVSQIITVITTKQLWRQQQQQQQQLEKLLK